MPANGRLGSDDVGWVIQTMPLSVYDRHGAEQVLGTGPHLGVTLMRMARCS
jgi:hypothetical protein